jgi:hypothetical protein
MFIEQKTKERNFGYEEKQSVGSCRYVPCHKDLQCGLGRQLFQVTPADETVRFGRKEIYSSDWLR